MPRYEEKMPMTPSHPMVEDTMDTAKSIEVDLTNADTNWRERRDSLILMRNAHMNSADLLTTAINRINYFLREDRESEPCDTTVSNEAKPAFIHTKR